MARAGCRGHDPELWFPRPGEAAADGKRICGRCPVTADCLMHAVRLRSGGGPLHGIWAGIGDWERLRTLRKVQQRIGQGASA
jgi:WhiB family redox-sensing transcriptional regulator